jgi:hypothetical protein
MKWQAWMAVAVAGVVGIAGGVQALDAAPAASATVPAAAPDAVAGTLVFGFEDDAWKAAKFSGENGVIAVAATNATEGAKALALTFDRAGKAEGDRPTIRINKVAAFAGAKKVLVDINFVGTVSAKTKIRVEFKDAAKAAGSTTETLTEGKSTIEVDMTTCDANNLNFGKIALDNCTSGRGVLYVDNVRIVK